MGEINQLTLPDGTVEDLLPYKYGVYPVFGTQTAVTGSWTGILDIPALYDGLTIAYFLPYNGSGNATLNLILSGGVSTGAKNVYWTGTSRMTTHYGAGSCIILTYFSKGSISVNGTATTDDRWIRCDYNSNTTYTAGTGLSLSGTTFSLATSGATAGSYGPSAAVTGNDGTTMNVPYITVDAYGKVTSISNKVYTAKNTTYTAASATPLANGTAAVGTSAKYAREDHVHPLQTTISGNAASATKLETARTIDGVSFDGSAAIIHFGTCSTAAATVAKEVSCTGFTLVTGAWVAVKFSVTNTGAVASLTLNVNSTGAKSIKYRGGNLPAVGTLTAKRVYLFVYDGTNYELVGDLDTNTNTTYTAGTGLSLSGTTFSLATSGATAGSYGPSAAVTGSEGATLNVPYITVDAYGRVTSVENKVYTSKNTTYTAASATPAKIGTAAVGTSAKYAREDHVHAIDLATGDSNGQVKIAGTNVSVKGLGSAAYTASTAYAAASHTHNYAGSASAGGSATSAVKLDAFKSASSAMAWGNQTGDVLACYATNGGGGLGFRDNNPASGQVSMTIDGTVYIKEGAVNVGDAIKSITRSGTTFTYTTLWGNTGTFTQQDNNTTYTAGTGLALSGTTFNVAIPRVAKSANSLPGTNKVIFEEYSSGSSYNLPSNHYYHIITMEGPDSNYATQLALGMNTSGAYYRRYYSGTWSAWASIVNTDTNNAVTNTLATTTKYYVTGTTSASTNTGGQSFDTGIYATTMPGQLNATSYKVNEKVTAQWNATDESLDFVFA